MLGKSIAVILISGIFILGISQYSSSNTTTPPASGEKIENSQAVSLLDKYAENQDNLLSFIVKYEETYDAEILNTTGSDMRYNGKYKKYYISECRYDGNRASIRHIRWGNIGTSASYYVPKEKAEYDSTLYDGKLWIRHNVPLANIAKKHGSTIISRPKGINTRIVQFSSTGLLMGYMENDWDERVDSILRKAKSLKVREKPELINGSPCYVIEGVTRKGKYTLWLDPEHGYNIARVIVERGEGDILFSHSSPLPKSCLANRALQDIRFEKIDNRWVPMEVTEKSNWKSPNGQEKHTVHHKRTAITFNPDFNNAFVPDDIPDGSDLWVQQSTTHVPAGYNTYIWENGKPCDKNGNPLDFSE